METAHDRQGDDGSAALASNYSHPGSAWNRLVNSLMRTNMMYVIHILLKETLTMTLGQEGLRPPRRDCYRQYQTESVHRGELWSGDLPAEDKDLLAEQTVLGAHSTFASR